MRLYRLVGVKRHGHSMYREVGPSITVRAKHERQARKIVADTFPTNNDEPNPWLNSSVTRCVPVLGAHVRGKRAGMVAR